MVFLRALLVIAILAVIAVMGMRLAFPLPSREGVVETTALAASGETALGRAILPQLEGQEERSGMLPLASGLDAFAARVLLARAAEQTLDVQYYIWQRDSTGMILLDEVRGAAERGVRVRLLLDDNGIPGLDPILAELDALETVEVRIYNPFTLRQPKLLSYGFDFPRLNRRMHNKSFTADGVATVVGGRNVGDIYFAYGPGTHYIDTDVLSLGPAAADVGAMFDAYWNSASSYPASLILDPMPEGTATLDAAVAAARADAAAAPYVEAIRSSALVTDLVARTAPVEFVEMSLVADDPVKTLGRLDETDLLAHRLDQILSEEGLGAREHVDLVSAYFVPGERGVALLTRLAAQGAAVRVLTNSQEATDVSAVHGAYAPYRMPLLEGGVAILELKADPALPAVEWSFQDILGGSASSLHSKVFAVDDAYAFIGSFNFDPRSYRLNTEMGFLVQSPTLARAIREAVSGIGTERAYAVTLDAEGALVWRDPEVPDVTMDHDPGTRWTERLVTGVIGYLPVGWMM
jgi:putative cardiolipin synthase